MQEKRWRKGRETGRWETAIAGKSGGGGGDVGGPSSPRPSCSSFALGWSKGSPHAPILGAQPEHLPSPCLTPHHSKTCQRIPPLRGVVEPCSLELLRQTGRVPGAMLLGNMAQGPSLSPEPPPRVGLGTHWGPTWGPDPPSSHLAQPWQASSLYSLDPCTTRSLKGRENSFAEHRCLPGLPSSFPRSWILAYSGETLNS